MQQAPLGAERGLHTTASKKTGTPVIQSQGILNSANSVNELGGDP